MTQQWKDKYIAVWIPIGGSWGGSAWNMLYFASGSNEFMPTASAVTLRESLRTFQTMLWTMPLSEFYNSNNVMAVINNKKYTTANYEEFFNDINYPLGYKFYKSYQRQELSINLDHPGTNVYYLYSNGIPTPKTFIWDAANADGKPTSIEYGDGDEVY
jgi:hypothetical protein